MITRYHAKYYAHLLSQKSVGDNIDSLSQSLLSSTVVCVSNLKIGKMKFHQNEKR